MEKEKPIANETSNLYNIYELSEKGPVLYVRHAITDYNIVSMTISKEFLRDDIKFIDCCLSDIGKKQAEELSEKLKYLNICLRFWFLWIIITWSSLCQMSPHIY